MAITPESHFCVLMPFFVGVHSSDANAAADADADADAQRSRAKRRRLFVCVGCSGPRQHFRLALEGQKRLALEECRPRVN